MTEIKHLTVTTYPELGSGSFGIVYQAVDNNTGRTVAVKKMKYAETREMKRIANQELLAISKLPKHPNIVETITYFEHHGFMWIQMDFCDKGDLQKCLEKNMELREQVDKMLQSSRGIAYLHTRQPPIFHRDIKLKNFLVKTIGTHEVVKVCDFGLARCLGDESTMAAFKQRLRSGTLAGSPPYMAPEFSAELEGGLEYDSTVDVFALGLVFQQILEPNRPDYQPLSVEKKKAKQEVNIGYEMVHCHKNKLKMPTVIEDNPTDDLVTKRLKRIVRNMTKFQSVARKHIEEVEEELKEITENEAKRTREITENEAKRTRDRQQLEHEVQDLRLEISHLQDQLIKQSAQPPPPSSDAKASGSSTKLRIGTTSQSSKVDANAGIKTDSLQTIVDRAFKEEKSVELSHWPYNLSLVNGELWSCQYDGIGIYSLELKLLRSIEAGDMGRVYGAAGTGDSVVVAADNALYTMSTTGEKRKEIAGGTHTDVCLSAGRVYACHYDYNFTICVYDSSTMQQVSTLFLPLPDCGDRNGDGIDDDDIGHWHNICASSTHIVVSCHDTDEVYVLSPTGDLIQTLGGKGSGVGEFDCPRVCASDNAGAILVADGDNHRLQLYHAGQWSRVQMQCPGKPRGAVYVNGALYVVSRNEPYSLTKFV